MKILLNFPTKCMICRMPIKKGNWMLKSLFDYIEFMNKSLYNTKIHYNQYIIINIIIFNH